MQPALQRLDVAQRGGGIAAAPPGRADEVEHQARRGVVVARLEQVGDAVLGDAPRADARVLGHRVGRQAVHGRRVLALLQALEQVLLQQRVRPLVLVVAHRQEDLRARERHEAVARIHPERGAERLEHVAAHVVAERGRGVGAQAQLGRDRADALVPQLGGGDRAPVQRVLGDAVLVALERQVPAARPRVEELQREERIASALLDGAQHRRVVERKRGAQERLGVVGRERLELEDAASPLRAQGLHAERRVEVGRERLASRRHDDEQRQIGRVATQAREDVERVLRGEVQVVEPHQDRPIARDALEHPLDDAEAQLGPVEDEALARGAHGRQHVRAASAAATRRWPRPR